MATIGIYKITNVLNGKCYIGQSVNIEKRWVSHKNRCTNLTAINLALLHEGVENFTFEIIEVCERDQLNDREVYWITYYNSFLNGYNGNSGGDRSYWAPVKLSLEQAEEIKALLKDTIKSQAEIAQDFGVSQPTVALINTGQIWKDSRYSYPIRLAGVRQKQLNQKKKEKIKQLHSQIKSRKLEKEPLLEIIKKHKGNFSSVARELNVSPTTIRRWCASYELSTSSLDYYPPKPPKPLKNPSLPVPVKMIDIETGETVAQFDSLLEAERFLEKKGSARRVKEVCAGIRKTGYGYIWRYAES